MKELNLEAKLQNLQQALDFVDDFLMTLNCPLRLQMQIDVAVEEIFVNVANYAYEPDIGPVTIRVEKLTDPLGISITFIDHGVPFDPTSKADPDVSLSADERKIGGLGIFMVKKSMEKMTYEYKDSQNILTLTKHLA